MEACQKPPLFVKQKPVAAILARSIALGLCFFDSASAQSSEEKPEKAFWPREVKISEEGKVEQKSQIWSGDREADRWLCRQGG
jgi:hypothetical protein